MTAVPPSPSIPLPDPPEEDFTGDALGPFEPPPPAGNEGEDGGGGGGGAGPVSALLPFSPTLGEIEKHREGTRRWLAYGLIILLGAIALLSLLAVIFGWQKTDDVRSIADVVFPPIVALTGSALGFFYGVERGSTP
jgi:hypothetical protein